LLHEKDCFAKHKVFKKVSLFREISESVSLPFRENCQKNKLSLETLPLTENQHFASSPRLLRSRLTYSSSREHDTWIPPVWSINYTYCPSCITDKMFNWNKIQPEDAWPTLLHTTTQSLYSALLSNMKTTPRRAPPTKVPS
jgi:hypothetical protein